MVVVPCWQHVKSHPKSCVDLSVLTVASGGLFQQICLSVSPSNFILSIFRKINNS